MTTKIIRNGQGYEIVRLVPEEREKVLQALARENAGLFGVCLVDAAKALDGLTRDSDLVVQAACALFDKLATASYTVLADAVTEKAHRLKNGQAGH